MQAEKLFDAIQAGLDRAAPQTGAWARRMRPMLVPEVQRALDALRLERTAPTLPEDERARLQKLLAERAGIKAERAKLPPKSGYRMLTDAHYERYRVTDARLAEIDAELRILHAHSGVPPRERFRQALDTVIDEKLRDPYYRDMDPKRFGGMMAAFWGIGGLRAEALTYLEEQLGDENGANAGRVADKTIEDDVTAVMERRLGAVPFWNLRQDEIPKLPGGVVWPGRHRGEWPIFAAVKEAEEKTRLVASAHRGSFYADAWEAERKLSKRDFATWKRWMKALEKEMAIAKAHHPEAVWRQWIAARAWARSKGLPVLPHDESAPPGVDENVLGGKLRKPRQSRSPHA